MKKTVSINPLIKMLGLKSERFPTLKTASTKLLLMIFLPAIIILVAIGVVSILYQIPIPNLTKDTTAIAHIHPLSGVLSNLGILLWCVAGTACAFAALILRSVKSRETYLFLLSSSLLSAYMMFDDLFQFHEDLSVRIGLNENVIYIILGIAVLTYLVYFRKIIFQTDIIVFLIALAFLALSLVVDKIGGLLRLIMHRDWEYFIEDGAKWIGIVFWCSYYIKTSFHFTTRIIDKSSNTTKSDVPSLPH